MRVKLRLTQTQHKILREHLFPGDGCEAVAVALCGRRRSERHHCLSVRTIVSIPYDECKERTPDRVTWSTRRLVPLLEEAAKHDLAVLKIHSHPGGYDRFSTIDDISDKDLFSSVSVWTETDFPHASAVMLPDGRMFGRAVMPDGDFRDLDSILIPGDDIRLWVPGPSGRAAGFTQRHAQMFGAGTTRLLRELAVAVIGCSGTGSPLIEQLARLGVGRFVLVDPDRVEEKNLNRILNATREDSYLHRPKVEVMARAIAAMGLGTELEIIAAELATPAAIRAVAECDVVFGCMDGVEGRHLLNRLASYYSLPFFDLGVKLEADGEGGIDEAGAAIHYVKPDGATLKDRGVYTSEHLRAAGLRRTDPEAYRAQVQAGYIRGVAEDRPAVISINMQTASMAVNEFLARLHPYRLDDNAESSVVRADFSGGVYYRFGEQAASGMFFAHIGKGDVSPLLSMPNLSETEKA